MVSSRVLAFSAHLESLYEMLAFIREEAMRAGFNAQLISKIELASEEALVNIINYGFPNETQDTPLIDIECLSLDVGGLQIVVRDQGVAYNPLENNNTFNPKTPADDRLIGGYGIFFIMNLMDEVRYVREDNSNILTLVKFL